MTVPLKKLLFHMVIRPPEAPAEGEKAKASRCLGQNFFKVKAVKTLSLCFLHTNDVAGHFLKF